jgi:hypothetical protein
MKPEMRGVALALSLLALVGCTLSQTEIRKANDSPRMLIGNRVIAAKRCLLKVAILSRPVKDEALNTILWRSADEQGVPADTRRALEANGLRVGLITGDLPSEVKEILEARPPHKVDPLSIANPSGEPALVDMASAQQLSLFMSRQDKSVGGKNYSDVHGYLRIVASYDSSIGVSIRAAPELHHGPFQHGWTAAPAVGPMAPMQFMAKTGQQEETFRDLEANLNLMPGQIAVFGSLPEKRGSLGDFLFSGVEPNSDRIVQKVVLVWASRVDPVSPGEVPGETPRLEPAETPDMPVRPAEAVTKPEAAKDASPATAPKR